MTSPTPGYYPDPSIPGYIRYWNGSAWVPGTSRPAPLPGEDVAPPAAAVGAPAAPSVAAPAGPAGPSAPRMPAMQESGPMFLDEDPDAPVAQTPDRAAAEAPGAAGGPVQPAVPAQAAREAAVRETPRPQRRPEPAERSGERPGDRAADRPADRSAPQPAPWAQQVQELARTQSEEAAPQPWKPVVSDPFLLAAQEQARPASLGRRLVARLLDSLVVGAVAAVAAVPLGSAAYDHIQHKIDAARQTGETVTVWLIDGTTGVQFGIIAGLVLVTGLLYEVLPTVKWGRTLGKKLLRIKVLDIESQYEPGFGAALRRWLTHTVLDAAVIGFVGLAWCLFDRPWRQCWHDKAARTFVAAD